LPKFVLKFFIMGLKKHIPNAVTCMNLVCGCASIHFAYQGHLDWSGLALFAAALFDFADGFVARLLHVKSELGKQLDSLSDVVSFGVAPGVIMFQLILLGNASWALGMPQWIAMIALLLPIMAALRLANFNIDTRQSDSFIGLPTPAMGLVVATLPILVFRNLESPLFPFNDYVVFFVLHPAVLISVTIVFAFLMVSPLPLFAMKFASWGWKQNKLRYIFLIVSFLLLLLFFFTAIPFVILIYILLSIFVLIFKKKNHAHDQV
jgi:CDP-diacylglycerol--serine O-phosphatidyltransferase